MDLPGGMRQPSSLNRLEEQHSSIDDRMIARAGINADA